MAKNKEKLKFLRCCGGDVGTGVGVGFYGSAAVGGGVGGEWGGGGVVAGRPASRKGTLSCPGAGTATSGAPVGSGDADACGSASDVGGGGILSDEERVFSALESFDENFFADPRLDTLCRSNSCSSTPYVSLSRVSSTAVLFPRQLLAPGATQNRFLKFLNPANFLASRQDSAASATQTTATAATSTTGSSQATSGQGQRLRQAQVESQAQGRGQREAQTSRSRGTRSGVTTTTTTQTQTQAHTNTQSQSQRSEADQEKMRLTSSSVASSPSVSSASPSLSPTPSNAGSGSPLQLHIETPTPTQTPAGDVNAGASASVILDFNPSTSEILPGESPSPLEASTSVDAPTCSEHVQRVRVRDELRHSIQ